VSAPVPLTREELDAMSPREVLTAMKSERGHAMLDRMQRDQAQREADRIANDFGVSPERFARMSHLERVDAARAHHANKIAST
jgi:hypothetical protein